MDLTLSLAFPNYSIQFVAMQQE